MRDFPKLAYQSLAIFSRKCKPCDEWIGRNVRSCMSNGIHCMGENLNYLLHCTETSLFQRNLSFRIKTTLYVRLIVKPQFWMVISESTDYQSIKSVHRRLCVSFLMTSAILNLSLPKKSGFEVKNGTAERN